MDNQAEMVDEVKGVREEDKEVNKKRFYSLLKKIDSKSFEDMDRMQQCLLIEEWLYAYFGNKVKASYHFTSEEIRDHLLPNESNRVLATSAGNKSNKSNKSNRGNRGIYGCRQDSLLAEQMRKDGYCPSYPVVVRPDSDSLSGKRGGKAETNSGHRRAAAATISGSGAFTMFDYDKKHTPQYYAAKDEFGVKWSTDAWANFYAPVNKEYWYLLKYSEKYNLRTPAAIMILEKKVYGFNNDTKRKFATGEFKVKSKSLGEKIGKILSDFSDYHPNITKMKLVAALLWIILRGGAYGQYDHERMMGQLKKNPNAFREKVSSAMDHIVLIQEIYNKGISPRSKKYTRWAEHYDPSPRNRKKTQSK